MSGSAHVAMAHFEQTAGFELDDVRTVARGNGAGVRLQGDKTVVLGSGGAEAFIVSARTMGSSGADGIGFYIVDRDAPGLAITPFRIADGSVASRLRLQDVAVRDKLDVNFDAFLGAVDDSRIAACAEMIGIMSTLFETTLDYVRTRKQFGAPIGSFQVVQHRMADLYVSLEQSRSQLYRAALSGTSVRAQPAAVAGMKSYVSAAAVEMGEQCIHLHGGMGITDELLIGHGHKRLLVLAAMFGDADHELQRFARLNH
jgi:alkylation response protein AidB-like acyl-CoA dehydrogenase